MRSLIKRWYEVGYENAFFILPILVIVFIFRHVLLSKGIFANGDTLFSFYPYFEYYARGGNIIAQEILSGFPVFVSVTGVWFYPVNRFMVALFEPLQAYSSLVILNIIAAYIFTYLYAYKINFSKLISIAIATVYVFSGQLTLWAETLTNTNYYFLLPLTLYLWECARAKTGAKKGMLQVLVGIVAGLGWLSGHVQFVVYIHVFLGIYIYLTSLEWPLTSRAFFCLSGWVVAIFTVSALVGSAQILAVLRFQSETVRSHGVTVSDYFLGAYLPQDMVHFILPFWHNPFLPVSNPNLYVGVLPLILLLLGLSLRRKISDRRYQIFWWVFVICFVASWKYSPGVILHYLPFFNAFREAPRIMFVGHFGGAFVVGYTLKYLLANREAVSLRLERFLLWSKRFFLWVIFPGVLCISAIKYFFLNQLQTWASAYFIKHLYSHTAGLPKEHYLAVLKSNIAVSFDELSIFNYQVLIFLGCAISSYVLLKRFGYYSARQFLSLALVLMLLNISFVYADHYKALTPGEVHKEPATATFIKQQIKLDGEPSRTFVLFPGFTLFEEGLRCPNLTVSESFEIQKELLFPNSNMLYGVDVVGGYDNFMPLNVSDNLAYIGSEQSVSRDMLANEPIPLEARIKKITERKDILRLMNVRYIISHLPILDSDFKALKTIHVGKCGLDLTMYTLKDAWPRYFITGSKDFTYEHGVGPLQPYYGYNTMTFDVVGKEGNLFIGNVWLTDWRAFVDGKEVPIEKIRNLYMGVRVPHGTKQVLLEYTEPFNLFSR